MVARAIDLLSSPDQDERTSLTASPAAIYATAQRAAAIEYPTVRNSCSESQRYSYFLAAAAQGDQAAPAAVAAGFCTKPTAIAVRTDLRIARIQLAAVHVGVVVRLILVGNEIDADGAMLWRRSAGAGTSAPSAPPCFAWQRPAPDNPASGATASAVMPILEHLATRKFGRITVHLI